MKRSMKKYLMLLLAILSIVTLGVLTASAQEPTTRCDHGLYNSYNGSVHDATCTSEGYTEIRCGNCNEVTGRTKTVPAKGHSFKWKYVASSDCYLNMAECTTCGYTQYESDEDNKEIIYYSITLNNPAATASYFTNITYTNVVNKRVGIDKAETYNIIYLKEGSVIRTALPASPALSCEKDKNYGLYKFVGWFDKTDDPILLDSGESGDNQLVAIDDNGITNYLDKPENGESELTITENMVLYAGFRGVNVTHNVKFWNYDGREFAVAENVFHGDEVICRDIPARPYDMIYRYSFSHWGDSKGNDIDLKHIYDDVVLVAKYNEEPRQYNIEYYFDAECTRPIYNMGQKVEDSNIEYYGTAQNGLKIPEKEIDLPQDDQYIYAWTGKWVLATRQDYEVDLNNFTVPNLTPDAVDGSTSVRIIPKYEKKARLYDLKIQIAYPDDNNYHPDTVSIQILYANGKIADTNTITMNGDTVSYTAEVNYSEYYTIAISSTGYLGEKTSYFISNSDDSSLSSPAGAIIVLEKVDAYSCGCICHTIFKPIWVRLLNLLYALFGIEHVCCSDMFANIGSSLNYGPGK